MEQRLRESTRSPDHGPLEVLDAGLSVFERDGGDVDANALDPRERGPLLAPESLGGRKQSPSLLGVMLPKADANEPAPRVLTSTIASKGPFFATTSISSRPTRTFAPRISQPEAVR